MKRILMISYHFPPIGGVGSYRVLKFVKYLHQFGWKIVVLTVRNSLYFYYDNQLFQEIPSGVKVVRSESLDPFRILYLMKPFFLKETPQILSSPPPLNIQKFYSFFLLPDSRIGWLPPAICTGLTIIKSFKPNIIFTTAPPYTALLIGAFLKKMSKTPFIADLRDLWVNNPFNPKPSKIHRLIDERLEKIVIEEADEVIAVAHGVLDELKKRYPLIEEKITIIPQGYDKNDFLNIDDLESFDKFTFVYAGTFYGKANSPHNFFLALKKIFEETPNLKDKIQFVSVGKCTPSIKKFVNQIGIKENVIFRGFVPHKESIKIMLSADVLLFLFDQVEGTEKKFISGKTFEYLASRKPILALVPPDGLAAYYIKNSKTGIVVHPNNVEKIKEAILTFYYRRFKFTPDTDFIEKFSRENLTRILEKVMMEKIRRRSD